MTWGATNLTVMGGVALLHGLPGADSEDALLHRLAAAVELTEVPSRAPGGGPPSRKSQALRGQAVGATATARLGASNPFGGTAKACLQVPEVLPISVRIASVLMSRSSARVLG